MANPPRPSPLRLFFALFAAAYSSGGGSRELLVSSNLIERRIVLVTPWVLDEAQRNLAGKAPDVLDRLSRMLKDVTYTLVAEPSRREVLRIAQLNHEKDAPVVAGALKGTRRLPLDLR